MRTTLLILVAALTLPMLTAACSSQEKQLEREKARQTQQRSAQAERELDREVRDAK